MAVYVDEAKWSLGRMKMCHMIADKPDELNQMAEKIGVPLRHIQFKGTPKEHFDICKAKRDLAISLGAKPVSSKQIVLMIRNRRV